LTGLVFLMTEMLGHFLVQRRLVREPTLVSSRRHVASRRRAHVRKKEALARHDARAVRRFPFACGPSARHDPPVSSEVDASWLWEVRVRIRITLAGADDGAALYAWLRADPALARQTRVTAGLPGPDQLGALEIIDVVLTQTTAVASLALAVADWRRSRPGRTSTTITRPDGTSMTVEGPPEQTASAVERFLAGDGSDDGNADDRSDGPGSSRQAD
jgi:hypothetical protein